MDPTVPSGTPRLSPRVLVVGSLNVDVVHRVHALPRPGETVLAERTDRLVGGKGLNQAVAAARLGGRVALVGAVGDDADGGKLMGVLVDEGVDVDGVARIVGAHTGHATVVVDARGQNAIVVDAAANALLEPDLLDPEHLRGAAVTVASCEVSTQVVRRAFALASGLRILNPAPAEPVGPELLGMCDILTPNASELAALSGNAPPGAVPEVVDAARTLLRQHPAMRVVATLGAAGAVIVGSDGVHHIDAPRVEVVDTTGAGDCFNGSLAVRLAEGAELPDAVDFAVRAASRSVSHRGAASAMPALDELDAGAT